MVQSVELLLGGALDASVRREWDLLSEAGLPSQADHRGPTNAPHVTLGVASRLDAVAESALAGVRPPATLLLGGLLVFSGRRFVLSRLVVVSDALLAAHADVARALQECPGQPATTAPGRWTPHVTLARGLDVDQLGLAFRVLREVPRELEGEAGALRRWDGDRRIAWDVDPGPS